MTDQESAQLEHLAALLSEYDKRYEQRFLAQERAVAMALAESDKRYDQRFNAQEQAIAKAQVESDRRFEQRFAAQEKAISTADGVLKEWRTASNEWRDAMNDRERNFFSKAMGNVVLALSVVAALVALFSPLINK